MVRCRTDRQGISVPSLAHALQETLHRSIVSANERKHEYATLEHLLLALLDDEDAATVLTACGADLEKLRQVVVTYIDTDLQCIVGAADEESKPTAGFQRVVQRAVIHVQSSNRETVTGAHVLVALFSERDSHAARFLEDHGVTRYAAVLYISHGVSTSRGLGSELASVSVRRTGRTDEIHAARRDEIAVLRAQVEELSSQLQDALTRIAELEARRSNDGS
jgi:ATP-dependent Clp protease ATP-binding subunit ClpA